MGGNLNQAEVAAIIQAHQEIAEYLEDTVEIPSANLRARLIVQGVSSAAYLSSKSDSFVKDLCYIIRRRARRQCLIPSNQPEGGALGSLC